jgi:hypothetical protein
MKKNQIIYRTVSLADVPALVQLELNIWGEEMFANQGKWIARLNTFSAGTRVAERNGELIGVVVTLVVDWKYPAGYFPTWAEVSGNGLLANHNINGNVLYGIDLGVLPGTKDVANNLVAFTVELWRKLKKPGGGLGCRIPSLSQYVVDNKITKITADLVMHLAQSDEQVKFWERNGFTVVGARENYFPEDLESLGWGIIMKVNGSEQFWK